MLFARALPLVALLVTNLPGTRHPSRLLEVSTIATTMETTGFVALKPDGDDMMPMGDVTDTAMAQSSLLDENHGEDDGVPIPMAEHDVSDDQTNETVWHFVMDMLVATRDKMNETIYPIVVDMLDMLVATRDKTNENKELFVCITLVAYCFVFIYAVYLRNAKWRIRGDHARVCVDQARVIAEIAQLDDNSTPRLRAEIAWVLANRELESLRAKRALLAKRVKYAKLMAGLVALVFVYLTLTLELGPDWDQLC